MESILTNTLNFIPSIKRCVHCSNDTHSNHYLLLSVFSTQNTTLDFPSNLIIVWCTKALLVGTISEHKKLKIFFRNYNKNVNNLVIWYIIILKIEKHPKVVYWKCMDLFAELELIEQRKFFLRNTLMFVFTLLYFVQFRYWKVKFHD